MLPNASTADIKLQQVSVIWKLEETAVSFGSVRRQENTHISFENVKEEKITRCRQELQEVTDPSKEILELVSQFGYE